MSETSKPPSNATGHSGVTYQVTPRPEPKKWAPPGETPVLKPADTQGVSQKPDPSSAAAAVATDGEPDFLTRRRAKQSLWQKIGVGPLIYAAIFHIVLLMAGGFWIFQIIQEPEKKVDFMPPGGGGGQRGAETVAVKKMKQITPTTNVKRVFAEGAASSYTIPEQGDNFGEMSTLTSLSGGGMTGGLGGAGTGGGFGKGTGLGSGTGGNGKGNPFGLTDPNQNALEGTFYNLNFKAKGEPVTTDNAKQYDIVNDFVTGGWKEEGLARYQKAPQKLYQTKFCMPAMDAGKAPSAFGLKPDPHPRWLIVYRGTVVAPASGKFRFVGAGDDTLVVRFNGKNVFDFGYRPGTVPHDVRPLLTGTAKLPIAFRKYPMEPPVTFYKYPTTVDWNKNIGGMAVGPEVQVEAGKSYPIEILIGEGWGGLFCASLMIQESAATYAKSPTGAPILPLFRTDSSLPAGLKGDNIPPWDPQGPAWRVVSHRGFTDF